LLTARERRRLRSRHGRRAADVVVGHVVRILGDAARCLRRCGLLGLGAVELAKLAELDAIGVRAVLGLLQASQRSVTRLLFTVGSSLVAGEVSRPLVGGAVSAGDAKKCD